MVGRLSPDAPTGVMDVLDPCLVELLLQFLGEHVVRLCLRTRWVSPQADDVVAESMLGVDALCRVYGCVHGLLGDSPPCERQKGRASVDAAIDRREGFSQDDVAPGQGTRDIVGIADHRGVR